MSEISVIGDIHGHLDAYHRLLREDGLMDDAGDWCGGDRVLFQIGDLFDRGPDGIGCVDTTIRLQQQAREAGGRVECILGNHEIMFLAACLMGESLTSSGMRFFDQWQYWGGIAEDRDKFRDRHAEWLLSLPAMVMHEDTLLIHGDCQLYLSLGSTVEDVNAAFTDIVSSRERGNWEAVLRGFGEHASFCHPPVPGAQRAMRFLDGYRANAIIHGHTPIPMAQHTPAESVTEAWRYVDRRCVNVDGGIYMGGPGFVTRWQGYDN